MIVAILFTKKNYLLTLLGCLVFTFCMAQNSNSETNAFWENVRFGGGIGLSFGDNFFSASLSPSAIYEFNNQFALGIGLNGSYAKQNGIYKSTVLGGSISALFNPIDVIQLSAELEELHVNQKFDARLSLLNNNYWYSALFLGAGYRNRNMTIGIRYDVLYDENKSIYADPWIPFIRFYF